MGNLDDDLDGLEFDQAALIERQESLIAELEGRQADLLARLEEMLRVVRALDARLEAVIGR